MQPDPAVPEFKNFIARIVWEILNEKRNDNFEACCSLVSVAYVLACDDALHRIALANYMTKVARELDPDCEEVITWQ
jgi:hypothetical protein